MIGTFSPSRASECVQCSPGKYTPGEGLSRCLVCEAGTYAQAGAGGCEVCEAGQFALWEKGECTPCEAGSYARSARSMGCTVCEIATWSDQGATGCVECQAGSYSGQTGGAGIQACTLCPNGFFSAVVAATSMETCQECAPGLYAPVGSTACRSCPAGSYTSPYGPGCLACPPLSGSPGGVDLTGCVCVGGYVRAWSADRLWFTCDVCGNGTFTTGANASACLACSAGKFALFNAGFQGTEDQACAGCAPGWYTGTQGRMTCSACPKGLVAAVPGQTGCDACPAGQFNRWENASTCQECSPGEYNRVAGVTVCARCQAGQFTTSYRATACVNCSAGEFLETTGGYACMKCPGGSYSSERGVNNASLCRACLQGRYSTGEGMTSAKDCKRCPVGLTTPPGGTSCFPCPAGEFPNQMYGACASCPAHSVVLANVTTPEGCRCGPGYFLGYNSKALGGEESYELGRNGLVYRQHLFNTYDEGILVVAEAALSIQCNGVQTVRPYLWRPDFYPPVVTPEQCTLPMVMSYPVDIEFDALETSTHMQCVPCPQGTFSADGGTEEDCITCPAGQFQDRAGQSTCTGCPPGSLNLGGGESCSPCPPQTYQVGEACVQCADGFFTLGIGQTECVPCPTNMWSTNATGGCKLCPPLATSPGGTGPDGCLCREGRSLLLLRNTLYCAPCRAGTYSPAETNECLACPAGTFGNTSGLGACHPCPSEPSIWTSGGEATACVACAAGTMAGMGMTACVACPVAKVCSGNASMVDCPLGTYMETGNISTVAQCRDCPANFFCASSTSKTACPAGTSTTGGATVKTDCLCKDQYDCVFTTKTTTRLSLSVTPEQFEANREAYIAAIAAYLGVSPSSIRIVSVAAVSTGGGGGMRRSLRGGGRLRRVEITLDAIGVGRGQPSSMALNRELRARGLAPALEVQQTEVM